MTSAEVYLWGTRIGVVIQENLGEICNFNYDRKFLKSQIELSPIVMPLSERIYSFPALNIDTFRGLPGLLADSLPDKFGTKLIERYLADLGRNIKDMSPVEHLCAVGKRGMGALEYVPDRSFSKASDQSVDIDGLVKLASDILQERESVHTEDMEQIIKIGTSAGGARAKAVIAWNEDTNDIRSGQIDAGDGYGYWLIKFDGVENNKDKGDKADDPEYTVIEYAYYAMAKAAGIHMNECRLFESNGKRHFMTRRFDREKDSGNKIHMQSLGAIAHYDFNQPGAYSYEQASDVIYRLGMGQKNVEELYRRMVFNVMARNQDDHVKNLSFLMNRRGEWSLAPAYDITYAYDRSNMWIARHQMSVNGKMEDFTLEDLQCTAARMNITKSRAVKIIENVGTAVKNWREYAEQSGLSERNYETIKREQIVF